MHPLIFFYRRTLFIVVTVYLLDYPALQMSAHYVLTMCTVAYFGWNDRFFDDRPMKIVEIGSEFLLDCISIVLG